LEKLPPGDFLSQSQVPWLEAVYIT
jgi:hypothetical protein